MKLVLATANRDKATEITEILGAVLPDVEFVARPSDLAEVEETGDTLEANARLKAVALVEATNLPAVADDTGLEVDALGGAPGVYSSRYSGPDASYADNVAKLLRDMEGVAAPDRGARFATVAIVCWPDGTERLARGEVEGSIAPEPRGENGFGYDPVFVPEGSNGRTFAEMTPEEKHAVSHRGRAFRALAGLLAGA